MELIGPLSGRGRVPLLQTTFLLCPVEPEEEDVFVRDFRRKILGVLKGCGQAWNIVTDPAGSFAVELFPGHDLVLAQERMRLVYHVMGRGKVETRQSEGSEEVVKFASEYR